MGEQSKKKGVVLADETVMQLMPSRYDSFQAFTRLDIRQDSQALECFGAVHSIKEARRKGHR